MTFAQANRVAETFVEDAKNYGPAEHYPKSLAVLRARRQALELCISHPETTALQKAFLTMESWDTAITIAKLIDRPGASISIADF